ncbi:MAG: PaaX family transcriptional regulator [Actinomycetota bacterium]|nr:PaaX family transcriptional regulator [Actinomycetota bacterium]
MARTTTLTPTPSARTAGSTRSVAPSSARSLLLTVLGEHVLPGGGQVWTSTALDALSLLGVGTPTARQALARSAAAGLLTASRVGRRTRWDLTARATALLAEGTERISSFGRRARRWDGQWLLITVTVPEPSRHLRHQLRVRLGWAGFAPLAAGSWISPWTSREGEAISLLAALGLEELSTVFVSRLGGSEDALAVAGRIWDLDGVEADYRSFVARQSARSPASAGEAFAMLTTMVHDWRHFPAADPDLPAELLPGWWPGGKAAALFHDRHAAWAPAARSWWAEHV